MNSHIQNHLFFLDSRICYKIMLQMWLSKDRDIEFRMGKAEVETTRFWILDFGLRIENCTSPNVSLDGDYFAIIRIKIFLT